MVFGSIFLEYLYGIGKPTGFIIYICNPVGFLGISVLLLITGTGLVENG